MAFGARRGDGPGVRCSSSFDPAHASRSHAPPRGPAGGPDTALARTGPRAAPRGRAGARRPAGFRSAALAAVLAD
ncbi:MAG: hypothetical protein AVDCRST_MAG11-478 [uncultured Gemmatimonadaceae bacterium]|uniref:Uncharacterized protein n=1 Tax=uncultured Gemmatimonadaceae bacterium TaxID=246130 RepID=A0A6J4K5L4_9BACT|nr:MAG: hypothetical protein AVDCRST_MAG11-478 [uncultured Gemmatimonadaceae bacterium]